ncbi:hypothetical protein ANMWB30_23860 [Arthrobacter sp. MWB30]|nr:hypothetical protein ANMWB30_23860 [Arthrobacter sp. MWB30]
MTDEPWVIERDGTVAFRGELGSKLCHGGIDEDFTEEDITLISIFDASYEFLRNGEGFGCHDWFHTDGDIYQASQLMRVIRRKSDGRLFGFRYWQGGGKYGEARIEHNGDDYGFPSPFTQENTLDTDRIWYVFAPVKFQPLPAYVFEKEPPHDVNE